MDPSPPSAFRQALREFHPLAGHAGACEKVLQATVLGRDPRIVTCSCGFEAVGGGVRIVAAAHLTQG